MLKNKWNLVWANEKCVYLVFLDRVGIRDFYGFKTGKNHRFFRRVMGRESRRWSFWWDFK